MDVGSIGQGYGATDATQGSNIVGKDDFMKLLITQMQYQDPMNPLDSSQFASQLAQFSSLEQLSNLNQNVESSIQANYYLTQSINNTLTATLIGKGVKVSGNTITNSGQTGTDLGYNLPYNAVTCTVNVYDSAGNIVKTFDDSPVSSGDHKLSWDFTDNDGNTVPEGDYTFKVEAQDPDGNNINATTFMYGTIDGVKFTEDGTMLLVNGTDYNLSDILEILNDTTGENGG
jgi:flagellar basal-body rod modification protein FlgD